MLIDKINCHSLLNTLIEIAIVYWFLIKKKIEIEIKKKKNHLMIEKMTYLKINHDILKKIIDTENLVPYRKGYNIKNRVLAVKPIIDLLLDIDPLLKNVLNVTYARHNPSSGLYLTIRVECKACKIVAYNINLNAAPDQANESVELTYERKGDHLPDKHLTIIPDRITGDARIELAKEVLSENMGASLQQREFYTWMPQVD